MKHGLQNGFQVAFDNHLGYAVCYRGNSQRSHLAIALRYLDPEDRRRHVATG